jgi:hypothetical protein
VVLINTSLRPFSPFWQRLQPRNYLPLLHRALWGPPAKLEALLLQVTSQRADPALLADWLRYRADCPVSRRNALRQLAAAARFRASLACPVVPMLALAGLGDRLVNPRCSQALAEGWRIPCRGHPTAGHDLPLDEPAWVIDTIQHWQATLSPHAAPKNVSQTVSADANLPR